MAPEVDDRDRYWMRQALALAARGEGLTRPNPPVGAVVVRADRIVGRGWHRAAGLPHAEQLALVDAGSDARGATLYVTLEPCSTWGRTPPCTEAIIQAGVRRVVAGCADPNPKHRGRGFAILRRRGIAVTVGVEREAAERLLEGFSMWITAHRPWIALKLAMSLDGRIADPAGHSRWITSAASRRRVQAERRRADAIMVGVGTVLADDPCLLPRPARGRSPWRVVLDTRGRTPPGARLVSDAYADRTLVLVGETCPPARDRRLSRYGATVVRLPVERPGGRVDLAAAARALADRGILRVLCEGGSTVAGALLARGLADELLLMYAPCVLGADGHPAVGWPGWPLPRAPRFRLAARGVHGNDWWVRLIRTS